MSRELVRDILDGNMPRLESKQKETVNMTIPIIVSSMTMCNQCDMMIENSEALWRCEAYCDFDLCAKCYAKEGGADHPHKLTSVPSEDRIKHNTDANGLATATEVKDMLNLMRHGSRCQVQGCQYPKCRRLKGLLNHGANCPVQAKGGCPVCKKIIHILRLHASACMEPDCVVPHCKQIKEKINRVKHVCEMSASINSRTFSTRERLKQRVEEASRTQRKETKKEYQQPSPQEKAVFNGFLFLTLGVMMVNKVCE